MANARGKIINGNLILMGTGAPNTAMYCLPLKEVARIKRRMESGMPHWQASVKYDIDREDAALILATSWKDISEGIDQWERFRR